MGSVFEVIKRRRSIRKFQARKVEPDKIKKIIEAARLAPSASNRQPWRFVAVTKKDLIERITKDALGIINRWAVTAPLLIVGCTARSSIITHYAGEVISKVPYHVIDCSIAMEHIVLEAEELGISTCWVGWFNSKKVKKILNLPLTWNINAILAAGYAEAGFTPKPRKRLSLDKILVIK
ncbi:MAG: nitroreductase family protein [Actinomycetota bacterium]